MDDKHRTELPAEPIDIPSLNEDREDKSETAENAKHQFRLDELATPPKEASQSLTQEGVEARRDAARNATIEKHEERGGKSRQSENFSWSIDAERGTASAISHEVDSNSDLRQDEKKPDQKDEWLEPGRRFDYSEFEKSFDEHWHKPHEDYLGLESQEYRDFRAGDITEHGIPETVTDRWDTEPRWEQEDTERLQKAVAENDWTTVNQLAETARFDEVSGRHAFYNNGDRNRDAAAWGAQRSDHFTLEQTAAGTAFDSCLKPLWNSADRQQAREFTQVLSRNFASSTRGSAFVFETEGASDSIFIDELHVLRDLADKGLVSSLVSDRPFIHRKKSNKDDE